MRALDPPPDSILKSPDLEAPASTDLTSQTPKASPRFIDLHGPASSNDGAAVSKAICQELSDGLRADPAALSPKFFYNPLGSKLFEAITGLDEYYPTRTEASIFSRQHRGIAQAIQRAGIQQLSLIDLGAGNCAKAVSLMPHLLPSQYVPVDISVAFLRDAAAQVQATFPALDIVGVGMDFSAQLNLPAAVQNHDRVFFYPGSSLGNFNPEQSLNFLSSIANPQQGHASGLLLGIDLVKDAATLEAAYDDALGVTAAFNKNLLLHVNELLGSNFNVSQWRHVALFNAAQSRIEMHLEAREHVTVAWPGGQRQFDAGARIHTESSYKYTLRAMTQLLKQAGFRHVEHWTDERQWFGVFWATV